MDLIMETIKDVDQTNGLWVSNTHIISGMSSQLQIKNFDLALTQWPLWD